MELYNLSKKEMGEVLLFGSLAKYVEEGKNTPLENHACVLLQDLRENPDKADEIREELMQHIDAASTRIMELGMLVASTDPEMAEGMMGDEQ